MSRIGKTVENNIPDWRHITKGMEIPTEFYCDQPFIVKTDDGAWLCVVTTGTGHEGDAGQHVVSMRSMDQGRTWTKPLDVEPDDGPEASYAVLLKVAGGRIYCFYNHNTDNVRIVTADVSEWSPEGYYTRVDSLGHYVFKYTDDHGRTWSNERYDVPVREFECDRNNADKGKLRYFWNVGKPFIHENAAYVSLHKVGGFGRGFFTSSEGVLLKSKNILTENEPDKLEWETLPDGDIGLRTPPGGGRISEEHSYCVLSDGSFYCVYRSVDGHPVCTYSRDGGHTWSVPKYETYAVGHKMKHPRAANFVWKCQNGKFLYWFHNHGGTWYDDRNPVWLCGGVEADSAEGKVILWTQPEIVIYDDDTYVRMSYPDLVEESGKYYLTETQKDVARTHEVPAELLEKLWDQFEIKEIAKRGLVLDIKAGIEESDGIREINMPQLPEFTVRDNDSGEYGTLDLRSGFTLDMWVELSELESDSILLDNRKEDGQGLFVSATKQGVLEISLNDGRTENRWTSDPGMMEKGKLQHVAVVVDGGPKLIMFYIDGILNDGGKHRQFGWGRFSPNFHGVNGTERAKVGSNGAKVRAIKLYDAALTTTEMIGNYRMGR